MKCKRKGPVFEWSGPNPTFPLAADVLVTCKHFPTTVESMFALRPMASLSCKAPASFGKTRVSPLPLGSRRQVVARAWTEAYKAPALANASIVKLLRSALDEAVLAEDYAAAAMLRDSIRQMDPSAQAAAAIAGVKQQLRAAVAEEAYQDAARLRDHLVELLGERLSVQQALPQSEALVGLEMRGLPTAAEEVSHGVRVQVKSQYIKWQSRPHENHFEFGCATRVVNEGPSTIQLRSSHWHVLDAELGHQDISAAGALGEQVVLLPGEAYEFQSSLLLPTPAGVVEGRFEVWTLCAGSAGLLAAGWGEPFEVAIPRVGLKCELGEDGSVA